MPASGAFSHSFPSAVSPFSTGRAAMPTAATAAVTRTTSPIAEKRLGAASAQLARLLGQVGDGLEPRVGEHGERKREREVVPGRGDAEVGSLRERVGRDDEREAEDDEQELRREVEPGDDEAGGVELRAARRAGRL